MTQLTNKNILITGAAGGFGRHFTRQLLQKGNNLILADLDETTLTEIALDIEKEINTGQVLACIGSDLSTAAGTQALFDRVQKLGYPVNILINNAGIALMGRHDEVPAAQTERLMQINLLAPMRLTALFTPQMIERQQGHIINIGSVASWTSDVGLSAYSASKFGIRGFSTALSDELKSHNIQISAVYPFYSRTPILESPRFGTLAKRAPADPNTVPGVTNPQDVVQSALAQIETNTLHIFTDTTGRIIYNLQRFPRLFNWFKKRVSAATN